MNEQLKIIEMFTSIQGESSYSGRPCFFIRLAGCNLNCSYCDTQFAKSAEDGEDYSIHELLAKAKESGVSLVEITGGEPLMQKAVPELCSKLLESDFKVLIETNGSLRISQLPEDVIKILDCKCPSSRESEKMDLSNFADLTEKDEVKFVISDRQDYEYACYKIHQHDLSSQVGNILFSPIMEPDVLAEWILADKLDVRFQLQLHKVIWDPDERGR